MQSRLLQVGVPNVGSRQRFAELADAMFDSGWLTNDGPLVRELESRLRIVMGVQHCVVVANGTLALELAYRACGFKGEIIMPSLTFVATAHAASWQGMTPVFVDVDPETYCVDPAAVERAITPRTGGIVGVHLFGRICDVDSLERLSEVHGIPVVYDAAHALCCARGSRRVGSFGACEVFSFHATKFFNTFEGGAVATNDDELAERLRAMRNFGFSSPEQVRYVGTNGKMCEACAAMGLVNLDSVAHVLATNMAHHTRYRGVVESIPGVRLAEPLPGDTSNHQYVVLELGHESPAGRDGVLEALAAEGILAKRYFWPGCHRADPYASDQWRLPVSETLNSRLLALPTGTSMREADVDRVCGALLSILGGRRGVPSSDRG